jgi:hypothetical protein
MKTLNELLESIKRQHATYSSNISASIYIDITIDEAMLLVKEIEKYQNYYDRHQRFK